MKPFNFDKRSVKNIFRQFICALLPVLLITACNHTGKGSKAPETSESSGATPPTSTDPEAEKQINPGIATLTPEQIKAIGLELGKVENKELTATIKANGALRVPNESRGKATPLFSGVVKKLYIQLGSHVRRGQIIATSVYLFRQQNHPGETGGRPAASAQ